MIYNEENLLKETKLITHLNYPEDLMLKYPEKFNWTAISRRQKLSENFIEKFKDYVDWICISIHQRLSEDFIEKFKDKVVWSMISSYQNLSDEFIINNFDKIYIKSIFGNKYFINRDKSEKLLIFLKLKGVDINEQ